MCLSKYSSEFWGCVWLIGGSKFLFEVVERWGIIVLEPGLQRMDSSKLFQIHCGGLDHLTQLGMRRKKKIIAQKMQPFKISPQVVQIDKEKENFNAKLIKEEGETKLTEPNKVNGLTPQTPKKKPHNVMRMSSAGLRVESVLKNKSGHLKEHYDLGRKLGHGQFGTTFLCVEKSTGKQYACKSIAKRKLITDEDVRRDEDVEDVRREIEILHHLSGEPNVVAIKGAYEDAVAVHLVMEPCVGGELFDRITKKGHYTERKAANLAKTILNVIDVCHSMGVIHRDLNLRISFLSMGERNRLLKLSTLDYQCISNQGIVSTMLLGAPTMLHLKFC